MKLSPCFKTAKGDIYISIHYQTLAVDSTGKTKSYPKTRTRKKTKKNKEYDTAGSNVLINVHNNAVFLTFMSQSTNLGTASLISICKLLGMTRTINGCLRS